MQAKLDALTHISEDLTRRLEGAKRTSSKLTKLRCRLRGRGSRRRLYELHERDSGIQFDEWVNL